MTPSASAMPARIAGTADSSSASTSGNSLANWPSVGATRIVLKNRKTLEDSQVLEEQGWIGIATRASSLGEERLPSKVGKKCEPKLDVEKKAVICKN